MKKTYIITGMTCGGCRKHVEDMLSSVEGVEEVQVDLDTSRADISHGSHITTEMLADALPTKYTIAALENSNRINPSQLTTEVAEQLTSKFQQLKPLFLILLYITTASILLHLRNWDSRNFMLDFMGLFLIVFSFFKMLDLKGFPESFRMYDPLAKRIGFYALLYPFIETALGLMFLLRIEVNIAIGITLVLLSITTIGVLKTLLDKKSIRCACLGTALKLPMTEATFIENSIMIVMGVFMLLN